MGLTVAECTYGSPENAGLEDVGRKCKVEFDGLAMRVRV